MKHDVVEKNIGLMIILIIVAISFGTLVELVPLMFDKASHEPIAGLKPLPATPDFSNAESVQHYSVIID